MKTGDRVRRTDGSHTAVVIDEDDRDAWGDFLLLLEYEDGYTEWVPVDELVEVPS